PALARVVEAHEQLHQRRLPGAGRPDKSDRLAELYLEGYALQRRLGGALVLEGDILEAQAADRIDRLRVLRLPLHRPRHELLQVIERCLRLAVRKDDVAELLQRTED